MKRFSLVARLGPDDTQPVSVVQKDSALFEVDFLNGERRLDFGIGHALEQLRSFGLNPSEAAVDLLIIAALQHAADTRISRAKAQDGWTREIDLYVPVQDPGLWSPHLPKVQQLLQFLTGDRWRVFVRQRPRKLKTLVAKTDKLGLEQPDEVCLFSGGLDSLIGAIDILAGGRRPLLVSHYWDSATATTQTYLLERLRKEWPKMQFRSLRVRLGFDKNHLVTGETEQTQRGRSFLFFSLAALAASASPQATQICVPENGLIALNVPLDPLRFGALSTRTAHPHFIAGMNDILAIVGVMPRLRNPYTHKTKGEMVQECANAGLLAKEIGNSMSCSSPAKARFKKLSFRHCGHCVPCLIRRAAVRTGLGKDPTLYTVQKLKGAPLFTDKAEGEHIRSFQLMARRLAKNPDLAKYLVHKPGPLSGSGAELAAYTGVFQRGVAEVAALLKGVDARPSA